LHFKWNCSTDRYFEGFGFQNSYWSCTGPIGVTEMENEEKNNYDEL